MDVIDLYKGPFSRSQINGCFWTWGEQSLQLKDTCNSWIYIFPKDVSRLWSGIVLHYSLIACTMWECLASSALLHFVRCWKDHWCRILCCSVSSDLPHSIVKRIRSWTQSPQWMKKMNSVTTLKHLHLFPFTLKMTSQNWGKFFQT